MRKLLFLNSAQRFSDFALLLLRVFVGIYLIWGVWPEITDSARMQEYAALLAHSGFPAPKVLAPVWAYLQLAVGLGFIVGLFTRWAGIVCVILFSVLIATTGSAAGMAGTFPSGCILLIGLYLATHGAGRLSVDEAIKANQLPRASGGVRFKT